MKVPMRNPLILTLALLACTYYTPLQADRPHARLSRIKEKRSKIPSRYRLQNQWPARASSLIYTFRRICAFVEMLKTVQAAETVEENVARLNALSAKYDETVCYLDRAAQISPYYHQKLTDALEVISWHLETIQAILKYDAALQRDTLVADALTHFNELIMTVDPSFKAIAAVFDHLNAALCSIMETKVAAREGQEQSVINALAATYHLKRRTEAALAGVAFTPLIPGTPAVGDEA